MGVIETFKYHLYYYYYMVEKMVSVKLSKRLRDFLTKQGLKNESYDEVIWRLLGQKTLTKEQKQEVKAGYEAML
jgi:hypothetical protein